MKNLEQDPRSGILSFRKGYPAELRPFLPGGPRYELKVSLGATSLTECGASEKFRKAAETHAANVAMASKIASDVTPVFHPAATRGRPVLSRMSAGEATGGVNPARCFSSSAAKAAGVA